MTEIIHFEECLRDSPDFRCKLDEEESNIDKLEQKLEKLIKNCVTMVDAGKHYVAQQGQFTTSLSDLNVFFKESNKKDVSDPLTKIIEAFREMNNFQATLIDQMVRIILKNITQLIKSDIRKIRETKQYFDKISTDLDIVLSKNSTVPKSKVQDVEEIQNLLAATRSCFRHTALDYMNNVTLFQSKKRHEILGTLLSYMHACSTYYHQGSDLFEDLEPFMQELSSNIHQMQNESSQLEKELNNHHSLVSSNEIIKSDISCAKYRIEGYLFKRSSNAFKTWNRRWFYLYDNQLAYRKRGEKNITIMEEDLRLCTVRPFVEGERRLCFEVLSPTKSHILQADSQEMYDAWIEAMQNGIGAALQASFNEMSGENRQIFTHNRKLSNQSISSIQSSSQLESDTCQNNDKNFYKTKLWEQLYKIPGNAFCCDCKEQNPKWASINLGITLCIRCSGVHRSIGVHHSKVRSLVLDDWEPEIIKVMLELGNQIVNKIYEANVPDNYTKAYPDCPSNIREAWIKAKYIDKAFVKDLTTTLNNTNEHPSRLNNNTTVRKWSVRKIRRRPKSCDNKREQTKLYPIQSTNSSRGELKRDDVLRCSRRKPKNVEVELRKNIKFKNELDDKKKISESDDSSDNNSKRNSESGISITSQDISLNSPPSSDNNSNLDVIEQSGDLFLFDVPGDTDSMPNVAIELSSDQDSIGGDDRDLVGEEDIDKLNPNILLYKAALAHNLPVMCEALALGANKFWKNEEDNGRNALHQAILSGSVMACAYLLLNGVKINVLDNNGSSPLHLSCEMGNTAQVCLLLKNRADQHIKDMNGIDPLDIAVKQANADIVTLLRLGRLNEEIKDTEYGSTGDDTFNDVVKDFSQLAYTHPERLQRNNSTIINNDTQES